MSRPLRPPARPTDPYAILWLQRKVRFPVPFAADALRALDQLAQQRGISRSALVREAVTAFLAAHRRR